MRRDQKTPPAGTDDTVVMVFARAPIPGRCKTRLIPHYGASGAARLHRRLTDRTLTVAATAGFRLELWCEPSTAHAWFHGCRRRHGLRLRSQPRGDLGRKMALALAAALRSGARRAIVIGTDCAVLTTGHLHAAAAALNHYDCVLQAADDGGYVLIGSRKPVHAALRAVDWSSGRELQQTLQRLARTECRCQVLPALWDVDHATDVRRARRAGLL